MNDSDHIPCTYFLRNYKKLSLFWCQEILILNNMETRWQIITEQLHSVVKGVVNKSIPTSTLAEHSAINGVLSIFGVHT